MIEILTPIEVSELFRLSPERVIKMARRGEIPFLIVDGHMRFETADIEDWIKARKIGSAPPAPPRVVNPEGEKPRAQLGKILASEAGTVLVNAGTEKKTR